MIFSVDAIEKSKNNLHPTLENDVIDYDTSFFENGLYINLEGYKEFCDMIFEENIVGQKTDSIKAIDPTDALVAILTWFSSSYEKLGAQYEIYLKKYQKEVPEYKKYEDKLKNCMDFVRYSKEYYAFLNLDIDTSKTSYQNELGLQLDKLKDYIENIASTCCDEGSTDGYIMRLCKELEDNEFQFDVLRGRITKNGEVKKENFANAIYNFYRLTDSSISKEQRKPGYIKNVGAERVQQAAQSFFNLQNQSKLIKAEVDKCKKYTDTLIKKIKAINYMYDVKDYTTELHNAVVRDAVFKIKDICQMYILVFSGRLDAFKQFNKINKDLIDLRVKDIKKEEE